MEAIGGGDVSRRPGGGHGAERAVDVGGPHLLLRSSDASEGGGEARAGAVSADMTPAAA